MLCTTLGTNLIHDFTAVRFSVKVVVFCETSIFVISMISALLRSFIKVFRVFYQSIHQCHRPTEPETVSKQLGKSSNHRLELKCTLWFWCASVCKLEFVKLIVHLSMCRSSVPVTLQANKCLLMKAMQQAEQSVAKARQHLCTYFSVSVCIHTTVTANATRRRPVVERAQRLLCVGRRFAAPVGQHQHRTLSLS